jgi:hypothetical protein
MVGKMEMKAMVMMVALEKAKRSCLPKREAADTIPTAMATMLKRGSKDRLVELLGKRMQTGRKMTKTAMTITMTTTTMIRRKMKKIKKKMKTTMMKLRMRMRTRTGKRSWK